MRPADVRRLISDEDFRASVRRTFGEAGVDLPLPLPIHYVRLKPETGLTLGLGGDAPCGYVKVFAVGDPDECVRKYESRAKAGGWVRRIEGAPAVAFGFPLDRGLNGLPHVMEPQRIKHLLHREIPDLSPEKWRVRAKRTRIDLLRYKPERRAVVRVRLAVRHAATGVDGVRDLVLRAHADDTWAHTLEIVPTIARHLDEPHPAFRVPTVRGADPERRLVVQEWVSGRAWHPAETNRSEVDQLVRAIRRLRDLPVPPGSEPTLPFAEATAVLEDLAAVSDAELASLAESLATEFVNEPDLAPATLVHGDLHAHQFVLGQSGEPPAILDWDRAHAGDFREDLACLLSHLHLMELDGRLPHASGRELRETLTTQLGAPRGLGSFVAAQLAKLAFVPFRNLRPDWEARTTDLLRLALEVLATAEVRR